MACPYVLDYLSVEVAFGCQPCSVIIVILHSFS
jgi:hypothetical protein